MTGPLISTDDLERDLRNPDLRILDASWHLDGTNARKAFEAARIPKARFFDLDAVSDQDSSLPHMLPSPEAFAASMGALGIRESDDIVVYDALGLFSAARAWWMLRVMGAERVRVLDGGLPAWRAEGRLLQTGPMTRPRPVAFHARLDAEAVADRSDVAASLNDPARRVLDARPEPRFTGRAEEPRPGLRVGHMPGAANLPFKGLLTQDGHLQPGDQLAAAFRDAGLQDDQIALTTCGSGVTAAVLSLALAVLGRDNRLYDGSWAEWGADDGGPVVTGDAGPPPR
ncbi:3-mercaptopyruvate sulfurtransferase [Brevundimonas lutea]|uniref:3-mercaptopyruvate sulfurtransferase n=1 Tax=Brevundimonas lutea TaxID=2293980 RepID=UPI000F0208EC|nr:3-mercaptopyruvate sulfurtransferase [Brevundimonas lutea]